MFSFFWFSLTSRISPNIKTQLHWNHGKHFLCMYVNMVNMQYTIHITAFPWAFPAGSEFFFPNFDGKAREDAIAIHSGASFITIVTKITLLSHLTEFPFPCKLKLHNICKFLVLFYLAEIILKRNTHKPQCSNSTLTWLY